MCCACVKYVCIKGIQSIQAAVIKIESKKSLDLHRDLNHRDLNHRDLNHRDLNHRDLTWQTL